MTHRAASPTICAGTSGPSVRVYAGRSGGGDGAIIVICRGHSSNAWLSASALLVVCSAVRLLHRRARSRQAQVHELVLGVGGPIAPGEL